MEEMVDTVITDTVENDMSEVDIIENIDYTPDMGYDMNEFENKNDSTNISSIILWITICVCFIIGIVLGIILGRKSAMK